MLMEPDGYIDPSSGDDVGDDVIDLGPRKEEKI